MTLAAAAWIAAVFAVPVGAQAADAMPLPDGGARTALPPLAPQPHAALPTQTAAAAPSLREAGAPAAPLSATASQAAAAFPMPSHPVAHRPPASVDADTAQTLRLAASGDDLSAPTASAHRSDTASSPQPQPAAPSTPPPPAPGTIRVATWSPDLTRDGPGLLLKDIRSGKDAQIAAAVQVIVQARPDVLLLTGFDWDHDGLALTAFTDLLRAEGADYPFRHASRPNSGMASGLDLDGDGRLGRARDAQGFGLFTGQGGMAVLSRLPLGAVTDHSAFLWRDLPGNLMPPALPEIAAAQRLSSVAHWEVPVTTPSGPLTLLAWSATPPVFDGPEDRNGRRNHDEAAFWLDRLPQGRFVALGDANLDPVDGEGRAEALRALIARTQDPLPRSPGGAAAPQTGANAAQKGDPALDTAEWPEADAAGKNAPGNLRVDLVLPSPDLRVAASGVLWPAPDDPLAATVKAASRHRLVWVDLEFPR